MRKAIILAALVWLALEARRGPSPVADPACYLGLMAAMAFVGGKLGREIGLPVETAYVGVGVLARSFGVLPADILSMSNPLVGMALGWVGFGLGMEVGSCRRAWKRDHAVAAALSALLPCLLAFLALRGLGGVSYSVALMLGVAASLANPILTFVAPDHLPQTSLLTVFSGTASLLLYFPLAFRGGLLSPFVLGIGAGAAVAALWAEAIIRAEPLMKLDTSLAALLLGMVLLLQCSAGVMGLSLFLTALMVGFWTALRTDAQPRIHGIERALGEGMGALLLSAFGVQIAVERLVELPAAVWGIAAIYLASMIGGKMLAGALWAGRVHPYGRLTGIALLAQGPLLLEIDAQVARNPDLFGGAADTIHSVLTVAALVGSIALPVLNHLLQRVTVLKPPDPVQP